MCLRAGVFIAVALLGAMEDAISPPDLYLTDVHNNSLSLCLGMQQPLRGRRLCPDIYPCYRPSPVQHTKLLLCLS